MTGFIDEFTGAPIQSVYPSYLALNFTGLTNVPLEWSFVNQNTNYPFSEYIQVTVNASATNRITLPDATQTSPGQRTTIYNTGASTILVYNYGGVLVATIATTQAWAIVLTSNSTAAGVWQALQNASTTSSATAASLIDPTSSTSNGGMGAFGNYLKFNQKTIVSASGSAYTQTTDARGNIFVWNGGTLTYSCLAVTTMGNGFAFTIVNNSTSGGVITVNPNGSDTINGIYNNLTFPFTLNPGDACGFVSDGASTLYTFTISQTTSSITRRVDVPLTNEVGNVITLNSEEASASIQQFNGFVGTGPYPDITIIYPKDQNAEWIAYNASTHNNIIVQLKDEVDSTYEYLISPGNRLSLFSNGTHLYNTPNFFSQAAIEFSDGTVTTPSIAFTNATTTGIYRSTTGASNNAPVVTQSGVQSMYFFSLGNGFNTSVNTMNTVTGTYKDTSISIYSLMRAYE